MEASSGQWLLNFNGEIFNHAELREQLPGPDYDGRSDTETLLRALTVWGEGGIARCNGLFAFAALDRARRRVLLVRDRFGVKPLYFARVNGGVYFASEIGALFAGGVPREPQVEVLRDILQSGWNDGRQTPTMNVERVPPGAIIEISLDTLAVSERRWFEPGTLVDPDYAAELAGLSRAQLAQELEQALRRSVRRRLMADAELGTMCSGGVDSSLLTAYAADEKPGLTAFHVSVANGDGDRRASLGRAGGEGTRRRARGRVDVRSILVRRVGRRSPPFWLPASERERGGDREMSRLANDRGVRVLLTGEAADELFGGYRYRHRSQYRAFLPFRHRLWERADGVRQVGARPYSRRAWRGARRRFRRVVGGHARQRPKNACGVG